jgi:hypothetical protein
MALFKNKIGNKRHAVGLESIVDQLRQAAATRVLSPGLASLAIATESISQNDAQQLSTAVEELNATLQEIGQVEGNAFSDANMEAAQAAGILATDPSKAFSAPIGTPVSSENSVVVATEGISDGMSKRSIAVEAYDESNNRNASVYSIAYNLTASRQDEFGEAFFPTITVSPDSVGFAVNVRLIQVFNDFKRNISGALDNYNKINIIRGLADPTVLKNELTRAVPVHRAESVANFVAPGDVPPSALVIDGESITTAPLRFGRKFSLIALSQTDALVANGLMDATDSIDPGGLSLRAVYAKIGDNVLKFLTKDLPLSQFVAAPQGNHRQMNLMFTTDALLMNNQTRRADGNALNGALQAGAVTANLIARVSVTVSGSINVETGETNVAPLGGLTVVAVRDASGEVLDHTVAGPALDFAAAIEAGGLIGYDLHAYRANQNRRQRGQLLDVQYFQQVYTVPFRAPITALKPVNTDATGEASDLAALITATQVRTSNAAVAQLLNTATVLKGFTDSREGVAPNILGVGRLLVKPTFIETPLDMATAIDSVKSHERAVDVQAVLVNTVRDMAFRLWRDSEYQAAASALKGGVAGTPTVIIGTDPILARYLQIDGDLRTAGASFEVKVVATLDERMKGRIVVSFGDFSNVSEPNPLHFGCMAWKPELTVVLPISRGGSTSKELTVQPAFMHITNLPVMGVIEVSNLENVIASKVALYMEIQ